MRPKLVEKRKVQALRKQGFSYKEILRRVPVAKSSISLWCRDIDLTPTQKERLIKKKIRNLQRLSKIGPKAMALKRRREIQGIKISAKKEIYSLSSYEFKIAGTMLFWAEGSKTRGSGIEISNSDPHLIKFMVKWFQEVFDVPVGKIRVQLNIHADQDDERIKQYWSKITGISLGNFGKTYIKPEGTGHRRNILTNGVIKIRVGSEDLRYKIITWIENLIYGQKGHE